MFSANSLPTASPAMPLLFFRSIPACTRKWSTDTEIRGLGIIDHTPLPAVLVGSLAISVRSFLAHLPGSDTAPFREKIFHRPAANVMKQENTNILGVGVTEVDIQHVIPTVRVPQQRTTEGARAADLAGYGEDTTQPSCDN